MLKQLLISLFKPKSTTQTQPATTLSSQEVTALLQQGMYLHQNEQYAQACSIYEKVIAHDANNVDALHLLGLAYYKQDNNNLAIELISKAISFNPTFAAAHLNLGVVLRKEHRNEDALVCFDRALSLDPHFLEAIYNRAGVLFDTQQLEQSLEEVERYLVIKDDNPDVFSLKGEVLNFLGRFDEALDCHNKAVSLKTDEFIYYFKRGSLFLDIRRHEEAIRDFEKATQLKPDFWEARLNESLTRLLVCDYENGWEKYESRLNSELAAFKLKLPLPIWTGEQSINGKKILLVAEQGLGDNIFFSRYFNKVVSLGAIVYLCAPPPLLELFSNTPVIEKVMVEIKGVPDVDYYCYVMSLAKVFKTQTDTIPSPNFPFSLTHPVITKWSEKLKTIKQPRIGIFWESTTIKRIIDMKSVDTITKKNMDSRNIPLRYFSDIFSLPSSFITLQKDIACEDVEQLSYYSNVHNVSGDIGDFLDTAALIQQLDLVITIDTAVAHLAGTLGKPVWILLPYNADWRWLIGRNDSPWYPTARLFRQYSRNDWEPVLSDVSYALTQYFEV